MIDEVKLEAPVAAVSAPPDRAATPSPGSPPGESTPVEPTTRERVRVRRKVRNRRANEIELPANETLFQRLPAWIWYVTIGLAAWGAFSANPVLTPFSIMLLPVFASLLWFKGEPPALLFACLMQWLQAAVAIFYTNSNGQSLEAASGAAVIEKATWLSLIAVLAQVIGMRLALWHRERSATEAAYQEAKLLDPVPTFVLYLITFAGSYLLGTVAGMFGGLRQPLLALATVRWVVVFLLAYAVLQRRQHYGLLMVMMAVELGVGFLGYFSDFRGGFLVVLVVLATGRFVLDGRRMVQFGAAAGMLFVLYIAWSVIKGDYREFLNQGTGEQVVLVSVPQRVEKLTELFGGLNRNTMEAGLDDMIMRVSYVSYFAMAIQNVPANIPYEHGELWLGAVKHVFMPRLFFPNKAALDDSARASYYIGMEVAGVEQGTSIGIGYVGESYIDFGPTGMFAPILLLGFLYGLIYRYFVHYQRYKLLGFGVATSILIFGNSGIETSNVKIIGGSVTALLVLGLFARFVGRPLWGFVTLSPNAPLPGRRPRRRRGKPDSGATPAGGGSSSA